MTTTAAVPNRPRFGALLREFRLAAGLSQEALAELATMSADGISALERGTNRAPQRETLALLIRALNLNPEQRHAIEAAAVRPSRPRRTANRAEHRHNLPFAPTRLYGREREAEAVISLLRETPLVTLTGAGGVGKTRLAIAIGKQLLDECDDGVWFVDLAPICDCKLVPSAAAAVFGVGESADRPLTEKLAQTLHRKEQLLIVDNCEHVIEAAAALVQTLLAASPRVRVLATSRQSLNVPGEQTYRVASLEIEPAMALFADRAKLAAESFELTDQNCDTVERIVRRLDGIALAIELAATRLRILSPQQLEERLSERFRLLTGGSQISLPRQQTMRATIDWSYDLLEADEQLLFRRLAVFYRGFSLDAAACVCGDQSIDEWRVFELLASLVDKSLIMTEGAGNVQRYRLLDSMHAYALEKAAEAPNAGVNRRHAEYYTRVAENAQAGFAIVQSTARWASSLDPELENFRAALDWALVDGNDPELGVRLLTALQELWILQGLTMEVLEHTRRALEIVSDLPLRLQAALWLTLARMQHEYHMTSREMLEASERACELYEMLEECSELAMALRERAVARTRLGALADAENDMNRALNIYRRLSDARMVARALGSLGYLRQIQGQFAEARAVMLEVLQLSIEIGDDRAATVMSMNVAETDFALGDVDDAVGRARYSLAHDALLSKSADLRAGQESNLAAYLFAAGRDEEARAMALTAIRESDCYNAAVPMQHLAAILAPLEPTRAARLLGYVEKVLAETKFSRERTEMYTYERLMGTLHEKLGDDEISRLAREGAAMSEEQALKLAQHRKRSSDLIGRSARCSV